MRCRSINFANEFLFLSVVTRWRKIGVLLIGLNTVNCKIKLECLVLDDIRKSKREGRIIESVDNFSSFLFFFLSLSLINGRIKITWRYRIRGCIDGIWNINKRGSPKKKRTIRIDRFISQSRHETFLPSHASNASKIIIRLWHVARAHFYSTNRTCNTNPTPPIQIRFLPSFPLPLIE